MKTSDVEVFKRYLKRKRRQANRTVTDTVRKLKRVDSTPAEVRRALTQDGIGRLLTVTPPLWALVYSVAVSTGLRAKELASLTVGDLDECVRKDPV